ncbi:MAG: hypothetical protein DRJ05_09070, partial [Bacteroidetes bacterium]
MTKQKALAVSQKQNFKQMKLLLLTLLLIFTNLSFIFGQGIVINEIMSSNETTITDEDGDYPDWIELYNSSGISVNLSGYTISDEISNLDKWTFPEIELLPDSFLLVFASGKDRAEGPFLHTNFKIEQSGENLFLSNLVGGISSIDSVSVPTDNSYGCISDGNPMFCLFNSPTPKLSNAGSNGIYCSYPSGFYPEGFNLSLTQANENYSIYYTLDGKTPTSNSYLYSSPLSISNNSSSPNNISLIPTTPLEGPSVLEYFIWKEPENVYKANVIRFASFDGDIRKSAVYTKTFFVDPNMENRYTFPIISLVTDSLNLFEYDTGIYIPGKTFDENGWNGWPSGNYHHKGIYWERDIHISYFENDGAIGFETNAGMRMRGYGSASMPQKSFNVYFRGEYGLKKIDYPIFNNGITTYKRLVFRNSGNDFLASHFKDAMLQDLLKPFDLELQGFKPSVVFFNGEYWGIHNIREKYDKYYFKYKFGI